MKDIRLSKEKRGLTPFVAEFRVPSWWHFTFMRQVIWIIGPVPCNIRSWLWSLLYWWTCRCGLYPPPSCTCFSARLNSPEATWPNPSTWNSSTMTQSEENLPTGMFSPSQQQKQVSVCHITSLRSAAFGHWGKLHSLGFAREFDCIPWGVVLFCALISICCKIAYGKRQQNVAQGGLFNPWWHASQNSRRSSKQMQIWSFWENILKSWYLSAPVPCSDCCDWARR